MADDLRFADVAEGVRAAMAAYAHALDDGRTDDVVAMFTADGTFEFPGVGTYEGSEALHAAFTSWEPRQPQRHLVVNTHLTGWSAERVTAISDVVFLLKDAEGWSVRLVGRYHDTLRNEGGTWRFSHRRPEFVV
jgi:3-phenylpropionate/cinnamic acid dioxygenase small subunit